VLVVEDHQSLRAGWRALFAAEPDIEIVGEASTGEEALQKTDQLEPQVVLMDIRLPDMSGIEATARIKRTHPDVCVIAVTAYDSAAYLTQAIASGASGYLDKEAPGPLVAQAIRAAVRGRGLVLTSFLGSAGRPAGQAAQATRWGQVPGPVDPLTPRELAVLALMAKGWATRRIAPALGIAESTVRMHVQRILAKLGVQNRTQAALWAVRSGLAKRL
jgi:DNA-binding NarL/FixJ family response regulator